MDSESRQDVLSEASLLKPFYTVVDLGTLANGWMSQAACINDRGQVVGWSFLHDRQFFDGFMWESGSMSALGIAREHGGSRATRINDRGQIIGQTHPPYNEAYQGKPSMSFLYEQGHPNYFTTAENEGIRLCDVNSRAQIVGVRETWQSRTPGRVVGRRYQSFLWQNGEERRVTAPGWAEGEEFCAAAINESAQVVGSAYPPGGRLHACLWQDGVIADLGTLGLWSTASDINDSGQVVGYSETLNEDGRAFLWQSNEMQNLGALVGRTESEAIAINNLGHVVGHSSNLSDLGDAGYDSHGFLWQNGHMHDLNDLVDPTLGWEMLEAVDINNQGQIACNGNRQGISHGLLLNPC